MDQALPGQRALEEGGGEQPEAICMWARRLVVSRAPPWVSHSKHTVSLRTMDQSPLLASGAPQCIHICNIFAFLHNTGHTDHLWWDLLFCNPPSFDQNMHIFFKGTTVSSSSWKLGTNWLGLAHFWNTKVKWPAERPPGTRLYHQNTVLVPVLWHVPVIPVYRWLRQEGHKFRPSLG